MFGVNKSELIRVEPFVLLFAHSRNEFMEHGHFLFRPRTTLEGMELTKSMTINTLHSPMGNTLGNFHPSALEFRLVVAFTAKTSSRDLLHGTIFLYRTTHRFGFLASKLSYISFLECDTNDNVSNNNNNVTRSMSQTAPKTRSNFTIIIHVPPRRHSHCASTYFR